MEEIKKKKWPKRLIISLSVILILCLLVYFDLPVRGEPSDSFETYEALAKALDKDFIVPGSELLLGEPEGYKVSYKMHENGRQIRPMIFNGRGRFPTIKKYVIYGDKYSITCEQLLISELEEEKAKFVQTETIKGVAVNVNENGYRFFIDEFYYKASKEVESEIISMEQLRIIVEDIIQQANEK